MENSIKQHSICKSVFFHLLPGAIFTIILFFACTFIKNENIPKALIFYVLTLSILVPSFVVIIKINERKNDTRKHFYEYIEYLEKIPLWKVLTMGLLALMWAVFIFVFFGEPINLFFKTHFFSWMGNAFNTTDYITNPQNYSKNILVITWAVGLISSSIIVPVFEEIYFRGYLLPRISRYHIFAPIIGTVLFCLYHFFTPWMFLTRVIAIILMNLLVWKFKNIYIGIICHVLLNVLGDSILTIPIIFK